ncbi:transcriptional regulator with XRE-family HTH domain [Actinokineospora baliensis]|uniref:helix-turn-helix domain-containing protein n=1 Tax=Actinokineospora baliensis TaxID=547056 RepID=UPI0019589698|nr:helix-turn-helix transcriptional regulator [Actinokineospora baliensis]MBM7769938.1 transcriptional regulator with XRE-family HTH domain [Actinokineospora baliensis]
MSTWGNPNDRPDPAIWDHPVMRAALAERDIVTVYRTLKRHGISQRRIAHLTGQAQPEVSAIARGRQVMTYDVLARIADGLGVPRGLMGLAHTPTAEPATREPVPTVPDRREFMGLLAKIAMGATLTTADLALLSSPAVATPTPSRVGTTEVDQLRELTRVLWTQEQQLGGGAVRDAVIAQLGWARTLLNSPHTDAVDHQLHAVLSDLLALAGWASHGVGLPGAALRYTGQALAAARHTDDHMRSALALNQIGRVYTQSRDYAEANNAFTLATLSADHTESGQTRALIYASHARAHAESGHPTRATDNLVRAEEALANPQEPLPEPRSYTRTLLTGETGLIYTVLAAQQPTYATRAIDTLTTATAQSHTLRAKRLAFLLTDLATAHLTGGDPESGARIGHQVVDMATNIRSNRLAERLGTLRSATHKHPSDAQVADLGHLLTRSTAVK